MIVFSVPLPPTLNNLYHNIERGRALTKKGREYKAEVALELIRQRARDRLADPPYVLSLWALVPDKRVRDVGNMLKVVEDAVAEFLGYNDSLNHVIHLYKAMDRLNPRCVVQLESKPGAVPAPPDMAIPC